MKILVTGAGGFVGRRVCQVLNVAGHSLCALSRNPAHLMRRLPLFSEVSEWSPTEGPPPVEAFDRVDGEVHLAGESVAGRCTTSKKQRISQSRIDGTANLVSAMKECRTPPKVLISASAVGYYGDRGEEVLYENASPGDDFLAGVCVGWESAAMEAHRFGVRVVCLRIGIVLGGGGGALTAMLLTAKLGLGGPFGSGEQWWSWVHLDDVAGVLLYAVENEISGPVNVTSPNPERQKNFARSLGRALSTPAFLPAPRVALRVVLGEFSTELLSSKRVLPEKAVSGGYSFKSKHLNDALASSLVSPSD